jgi:hypothetical protein
MNTKGKRTFTQDEFDRIRELVRNLRRADRDEQKSIRRKIRAIGFFISDFESGSGFTEGDLSDLVQTRQIKIVG